MIKRFIAPLIVLLTISISYGAHRTNNENRTGNKVLKIALGDWSPYSCNPSKEQGKVGYVAEIIMSVFKKQGFTIETELMPFARILVEVRRGNFDVVPGMCIPNAPDFVFSDKPIGMSTNYFFVSNSTNWNYAGLNSLMKLDKLGLIKNYSMDALDPNLSRFVKENPSKIQEMTGTEPLERLISMMLQERITAIVDDEWVAGYYLKKLNATNKIKKAGQLGKPIPVYAGFSPAILNHESMHEYLKRESKS